MLKLQPLTISVRSLMRRLEPSIGAPILWFFFLAFGIAALFRQYLFAHSYWYDEAFLILTVKARTYADLLGPQPYKLVIPPLFLWIERALFEVGGDGELVLRLPAFVCGVFALLVMMPLSRTLVRWPHAIWAFAGLAVSRNLVLHSCDIRPYTVDLLFTEIILLCTATLLLANSGSAGRRRSAVGLGIVAVLGPWLSFPSAFVLAGASLALAVHLRRHGTRTGWILWLIFNALTALSGLALWWFSARHMYYTGMMEHWGHNGWWGFPNWQSPRNILCWLLWRPGEIGNYGNREMGVILTLLALVGGISLARRAGSLMILLAAPFVFAVAAALAGKYPLAHRTTFFLLPCLWLLAANGVGALVQWGKRRGWELAAAGLLLVAWDFVWLVFRLAAPDARMDYRGAYEFVHSHHESGDVLWSGAEVVHQVYYGIDASTLNDDIASAEQLVAHQRVWVVLGVGQTAVQRRLEAAGGEVILTHKVSGFDVLLFSPRNREPGKTKQ